MLLQILLQSGFGQTTSPEVAAIKSQMSAIRKSTNWSDAAAAKVANKKIEELSVQLTAAIRRQNGNQNSGSGKPETKNQEDQETVNEIIKEIDEFNTQLWLQMMKIVREGSSWDLAKPLRETIAEEYKADEDPTIKNPQWLDSMTVLTINLSMPQVSLVIDQMPLYKGIKTLIITADKPIATAQIPAILSNAKSYPLERLCIVNLPLAVTKVPDEVSQFKQLRELQLFNNSIYELPDFIRSMTRLHLLYLDKNPISDIAGRITAITGLHELGIAQTHVTPEEISSIQHALPACKILTE